jgi:hypothetical protein
MCVYVLIACSSKNVCGIAQLDVAYVTRWCQSIKAFSGVAWPYLGGWEC